MLLTMTVWDTLSWVKAGVTGSPLCPQTHPSFACGWGALSSSPLPLSLSPQPWYFWYFFLLLLLLFFFFKLYPRIKWVSQVALVVKNVPANAGDIRDAGLSPRSPGGGHGNPLSYSGLENPAV